MLESRDYILDANGDYRNAQEVQDFIKTKCIACGGNWVGMLMSGIDREYSKVADETRAFADKVLEIDSSGVQCFAFLSDCIAALLQGHENPAKVLYDEMVVRLEKAYAKKHDFALH